MTKKQKYMIEQVVASLELSGFKVTENMRKELEDVATGRKTAEQSIDEIDAKYRNSV